MKSLDNSSSNNASSICLFNPMLRGFNGIYTTWCYFSRVRSGVSLFHYLLVEFNSTITIVTIYNTLLPIRFYINLLLVILTSIQHFVNSWTVYLQPLSSNLVPTSENFLNEFCLGMFKYKGLLIALLESSCNFLFYASSCFIFILITD